MSSPNGSSSPNQNASFDSNYVIENKENIPPGMVFPSRQPDVLSQENQKNAQSAAEILSQQQQPLQVKVLGETNKSIPLQLANLPPFVLPTMKKPFSVIQSVSSLTRKRSTDQKLPNPPSFKREHLAADDDKMDAEVDVVGDGLPSPPLSQQSDDTSVVSSQDSVTDSPRVFPTSSQIRLPRTTSSNDEDMDDEFDEENGATTSRKEKSLGLLCQRFLLAMQEETKFSQTREVHLETVARKMNVEKRRIYDIVNVMEALDAMSKTNKSYYKWHGLEGLPKLMDELQNEALLEKLPERVHRVEQAMCSFTELSPSSRMKFNAVAEIFKCAEIPALSGGNRPQPLVGSLIALDENLSYLSQNGSQTNENYLKSMSQVS
ncbi:hypothetical protein WR25_02290 [Diploscapter pachys]|uniref:E2F/DP family winged-helix DNA-binding domain-containing protein n=1 Tax=Diploscapter pachys TaxID=2018661 RepID=A0A2A2KDB2_9BILA|nr:hypothetical protein WR25_02290 [Diploscapter pachys]